MALLPLLDVSLNARFMGDGLRVFERVDARNDNLMLGGNGTSGEGV